MATTLSPAMRAAMRKLTREWQATLTFGCQVNTVRSLEKRGLVDRRYPAGLYWRLTERGEKLVERKEGQP